MGRIIRFEDYDISEETGFTQELPDSLPEYYKPWHELASRTTNHIAAQIMREEALKLPMLDTSDLKTFKELKLAYLQLSIISSGYCWQNGPLGLPKSVPACVAVPLCAICDKLGVQPGISYYNLMGNWKRIDTTRPPTRDNIQIRYILPGGKQSVAFQTLAIYTEILFAQTFQALENILEGSKLNDAAKVIDGLKYITQWNKDLQILIKEYHHIMEPDVFVREITALLRGFNETSQLPDGMMFEGVTDRPKRIVHNTAGSQTVIFQIIDTLLRVDYPPDKKEYFKQLRESWPAKYRDFFQLLNDWPGNVREMALSGTNQELSRVYDELVASVQQFRSYHLQLATRFFVIPRKRLQKEMNDTSPDHLADLISTLKDIRNTTANSKLH